MELLILFMIAAVGFFWWANSIMKRKSEKLAAENATDVAPYKIESPVTQPETKPVVEESKPVTVEVPVATQPVPVVTEVAQPETKKEVTVKKPRKPAVRKPVAKTPSKPVAKKTKAKKSI